MKNFHRGFSLFAPSVRRAFLLGSLAGAVGVACSNDSSGTDSGKGASGNGASGNGASGNGASGQGASSGSGSSGNGASSGSGSSGSGSSGSGSSGNGAGSGSGGKVSTDPNDACGLATTGSKNSTGSGGAASSTPAFEDCTGIAYEGEAVPADIMILVDRSSSMGDHNVVEGDTTTPTRWEAITSALTEFINEPSTAQLRVGLQFFPLDGADACDPQAYAQPWVPIDRVEGAHKDALLAAITDQYPGGLTPAVPALQGALSYAKDWAENNPDRPTVLLWAADGYPTDVTPSTVDACDDTQISSLEALAEEYATGDPRIGTFVVGLGQVPNLKRVAEKGGTGKAFFVSECPSAVEDLLASLKRVSNSPALCEFTVPPPSDGSLADPDQVNVTFTPNGGDAEVIYRVDSQVKCGSGGWYYDTSASGQGGATGADASSYTIRVCPETCGRFGGGTVEVVMGCQTFELN